MICAFYSISFLALSENPSLVINFHLMDDLVQRTKLESIDHEATSFLPNADIFHTTSDVKQFFIAWICMQPSKPSTRKSSLACFRHL